MFTRNAEILIHVVLHPMEHTGSGQFQLSASSFERRSVNRPKDLKLGEEDKRLPDRLRRDLALHRLEPCAWAHREADPRIAAT